MTDSQPSSPPCGQVPSASPDEQVAPQKLTICDDHPVLDDSEPGLPGDSDSESGTSSEESLQSPYGHDESCIVAICGPEGFWAGQVDSFKQLNAMVARGGKILPSDDETIEALASLRRVIRCSAAGPWEAAIGNFNPLTLEGLPTSDLPPRPLMEDDDDDEDDSDEESDSDFSAEESSSDESSSSADPGAAAGDSSSESSFDDTNALGEDSDEDNSEPDSDDAEDLSDCGMDVVKACRLADIRHDHEQQKRLASAQKAEAEYLSDAFMLDEMDRRNRKERNRLALAQKKGELADADDDIKVIRTIPQTQLTPPKGKRDQPASPPKVAPKKKRIQIFSSQEK
jgi:hypothetical protein